ncbi:MAG: hypothetical protein Q7T16_05160 [Candidatus Burarchaeum sp.]|nr:hypothetical protein [Candidatus Burarchaeum sp.]MDO8340018.1 hypothetical protein [Candidatus Burarchaeum sp.]
MQNKLRLGVIGACGIGGRHAVALAGEMPGIEIGLVADSCECALESTLAPPTYRQALRNVEREGGIHPNYVHLQDKRLKEIMEMPLTPLENVTGKECDAYLLAVPDELAARFEKSLASTATVLTFNASTKMRKDVPLAVPFVSDFDEVMRLLEAQRKAGPGGGLVALPNCTVLGAAYALHGLSAEIPAERVSIYTNHSIDGGGNNGARAQNVFDNVKHVRGAREGVRSELKKVLGEELGVVCGCYRVPLLSAQHTVLSIDTKLDAYSPLPHERKIAARLNRYGQEKATNLIPQLVVASTDPDFGSPADVKFCGQIGRRHARGIKIGEIRWEPDATPSDKATLSMRLSYNNELMCGWAAVETLAALHGRGMLLK